MGTATCYLYSPPTGQELKASISWDSEYYVTVEVWSNTSWRFKPTGAPGDSANIFAKYGNFSGSFQGVKGKSYSFQFLNQVDNQWFEDSFILSSDSGGDSGGDDGGDDGGDSGGNLPGSGGGGSSTFYLITLDDGGYTWDNFPEVQHMKKFPGEASTLPQLQRSPIPSLPEVFKIKGNANGGVEDTYINASKQSIKIYNFTGWDERVEGTSVAKWHDSFTADRHANLFAEQEEIETTEYSDNTLASLPKPTRNNDIIKYNIYYNAMGGTASKTKETIEQNINYYFDYWSSDKSGNGEHYTDSSSFTKETEVFAIWRKQQGITPSVVLPTATKNGYKFIGWTDENQSTLLPAGAKVDINKNMNFNAVWESAGRIFIHDGTTWVVVI